MFLLVDNVLFSLQDVAERPELIISSDDEDHLQMVSSSKSMHAGQW